MSRMFRRLYIPNVCMKDNVRIMACSNITFSRTLASMWTFRNTETKEQRDAGKELSPSLTRLVGSYHSTRRAALVYLWDRIAIMEEGL